MIGAVGRYLETPVCGTALAIFRMLFGFLLVADTIIERGWAEEPIYDSLKDVANNRMCSFPLFDSMPKLTPEAYAIACAIQASAAICISVGLMFRLSCCVFLATFWSTLLLDKLHWNNHSYLYGIMVTILMTTSAHRQFSIDSIILDRRNKKTTTNNVKANEQFKVPYWNYFMLQIQIAIVYTYAGINKIDADWLNSRPLPQMSEHWVFAGLKKLFPENDAAFFDFFAIRMAGLLIDALAGVAFFFRVTRPIALLFTTAFHVMNSQMFSIGVFSGIMLATNVLFLPSYTLPPPREASTAKKEQEQSSPPTKQGKKTVGKTNPKMNEPVPQKSETRHYAIALIAGVHILLQILIPQCHSLFPGLMTWSKTGQYGFSWEMMLHEWDVAHITINLKDKISGEDLYLDADKLVPMGNQRWAFHPDMIFQFSNCVKDMLLHVERDHSPNKSNRKKKAPAASEAIEISRRFSLYIDSWISLNQRVHQRLVDPRTDFFNVTWSAFRKPDWVLPLLESLPPLNSYNNAALLDALHLWDNKKLLVEDRSKVEYLIFADFPGNSLHHFIDPSLDDVQLFVLNGSVSVAFDTGDDDEDGVGISSPPVHLKVGDPPLSIPNGEFHTLVTTSNVPSLCLYTFVNMTHWYEELEKQPQPKRDVNKREKNAAGDGETGTQLSGVQWWLSRAASRIATIFKKAMTGVELSERAFKTVVGLDKENRL